MAYQYYNVNPSNKIVGDCVVRAISTALGEEWDRIYIELSFMGFFAKDVFTSNGVWGAYLIQNGFKRKAIPDMCPDCYSIEQFAEDHPKGVYVVATGTHVVAVIDGVYYDTWQSGDQVPQYYFER